MWLDALWRSAKRPFQRRRIQASGAVLAFWEISARTDGRTSDELHALLDLWGFEQGETVPVYLTQEARIRWHKVLPDVRYHLVLEQVHYLHEKRVICALDVIRHLATVLGVSLNPPQP